MFIFIFATISYCLFVPASCARLHILEEVGSVAKPHQYPWILTLKTENVNSPWLHKCGASLLSVKGFSKSDIAVSAAHCFSICKPEERDERREKYQKQNLNEFEIFAGKHFLNATEKGEQKRRLSQVKCHPAFDVNQTGYQHDIAIIKFKSPIDFTKFIQPIPLPEQDQKLPAGSNCVKAGWGQVSDYNRDPVDLRHANVTSESDEMCYKKWHREIDASEEVKYNSKYMICGGRPAVGDDPESQKQKVGCQGDSGGPLMCDFGDRITKLAGINSFSYPYCRDRSSLPDGYAKVSAYVDWIKESIEEMTAL